LFSAVAQDRPHDPFTAADRAPAAGAASGHHSSGAGTQQGLSNVQHFDTLPIGRIIPNAPTMPNL
jgi:hypothetical protein